MNSVMRFYELLLRVRLEIPNTSNAKVGGDAAGKNFYVSSPSRHTPEPIKASNQLSEPSVIGAIKLLEPSKLRHLGNLRINDIFHKT